MVQPEEFDAFYRDARERLLAQTFALTGDLQASRRGVRDAFVVAWHRWRKLARLETPEDVVRPHAWRLAQRHATARVLHREKDLDPEVKATLDALSSLPVDQRRILVLTQLATVSMAQLAREVGLTPERTERELQTGTAALALARDVETPGLRRLLEDVGACVEGRARWPRASIIRRAGAARRRTHTVVGVLGVVATLVVSGTLVAEGAGARPSLSAHGGRPEREPDVSATPAAETDTADAPTLPEVSLLGAPQVQDHFDAGAWTVRRTTDNSEGSGIVVPCQRARYADPDGRAGLERRLATSGPTDDPTGGGSQDAVEPVAAVQLSEASRGARAARRAFGEARSWYADCDQPRTQLLGTRTATGVGDESQQFVLRSWQEPVTTYVVGLARTGAYTTTVVLEQDGSEIPDVDTAAAVLAEAVDSLCALPDAGACAPAEPELIVEVPLAVGPRPAMLTEIDLPPITGVERPWVGTTPRRPRTNAAATSCDRTSFTGRFEGASFSRAATRTFLVPEARLPKEFGLTETVGALPVPAAAALVAQVRDRIAACGDDALAIDVTPLAVRDDGSRQLSAWRLEVKVSDRRTVTFNMAIGRIGTSLVQLGFVPAPDAVLREAGFVDVAERALQRLERLRPPRG